MKPTGSRIHRALRVVRGLVDLNWNVLTRWLLAGMEQR